MYTLFFCFSLHFISLFILGRTRNCTNPRPIGHGKSCAIIGPHLLVNKCTIVHCPQNGNWGEWSAWGKCTVPCKDGKRTRQKECNNPPASHGGKQCEGVAVKEESSCSYLLPCPVNGGVGDWEAWSACSLTCGDGFKERKRNCNKPEPKYKGKGCADHLHEAEACKIKDCVVPTTLKINTTNIPTPTKKI